MPPKYRIDQPVMARIEVAPRTRIEVKTKVAEISMLEDDEALYSVWYELDGYPLKSGWIFEEDLRPL